MEEFPRIKVRVDNVTATGALALATTLITSAASGTLQDTWHNENDVFQQFARQGALKDIAPVLKSLRVSGDAAKRGVFDQAVQFVAWVAASKTAQELVIETGASTPVYKPVLDSQRFLAGPPASNKIVVDMIPDWRDPQIFTGWIEFRDSTGAELTPAFANQKATPDAAREAARVGQLILDKIPR